MRFFKLLLLFLLLGKSAIAQDVVLYRDWIALGAGVYLGEGLFLTSYQAVVGEAIFRQADGSVPLYAQLWQYDADGVEDWGEDLLEAQICQTAEGIKLLDEPSGTYCFPYNQVAPVIDRAFVVVGAKTYPVAELLYLSRAQDIALLRLAEHPPDEAITPLADLPPAQTQSLLRADFSAWEGYAAPAQTLQAQWSDQRPADPFLMGQPIRAETGQVIGLAAGKNEAGLWFIPLAESAQNLMQANLELDSEALARVLAPIRPDHSRFNNAGDPFSPELGTDRFEVLHYDLRLSIDPTIPSLEGIARLDLRMMQDQVRFLDFDLLNLAVTDVTSGAETLSFETNSGELIIELPQAQAIGALLSLQIHYGGELAPISSPYFPYAEIGAVIDPVSPRVAMMTQPDAARTWFPSNDHPSDAATYDFHLRVAQPYEAVANGILESITENEDESRTFHWRMDAPMASYLAVMAVADYEVIEEEAPNGIPLQYWVYANSNLERMQTAFGSTGAAMTLLENYFGPYPFQTYGQVIVPVNGSALETQTMSAMPYVMRDARNEAVFFPLIVHELAHQWFGNAIRLENWQDIWLNEGLATLAEWITIDEYREQNIAQGWRGEAENRIRRSSRQTPLAYPLPSEMFDNDSYEKAGWVFFMLKNELGEDVFYPMLQAYVQSQQSMSTLAFFQFAERYSGQDLTLFRRQWVEQAGVPSYELLWQAQNGEIRLQFCVLNPQQVYNIGIPILLKDETHIHELSLPLQTDDTLTMTLDFTPTELIIDPHQMVLEGIMAKEGRECT